MLFLSETIRPFVCGKCEHYENGYVDIKCIGFIPIKKQGQRLQEVMDIRFSRKKGTNDMKERRDLFEDLAKAIGATYVSDIKSAQNIAYFCQVLSRMNLV